MKKIQYLSLVTLLLILIVSCHSKKIYKVVSPDKETYVEVKVNDNRELLYRAFYAGEEILKWSSMGLLIDGISVGNNTTITHAVSSTHRGSFPWRLGESDTIQNNYNKMILYCRDSSLNFNIKIRVYNGSIAFRYKVPKQEHFKGGSVTKELTTFNFTHNYTLYQYNQESVFTPVKIDSFKTHSNFPTTLVDYKKMYISVGEADNNDYTKAELKKSDSLYGLRVAFTHDSIVSVSGHFQTPWRTISASKTAIGLHRYSQLYLKLVKPIEKKIPSWIKPGKLIRAQLTTQSGIRCVDFAASHHFRYVLFDAGWYGNEWNASINPKTPIKALDLQKVIDYGKSKNIGIVLYVNDGSLKNYIDSILPLFKKWGVAGLKFGFVDGLTQKGISWLDTAIRKTMNYGFILNIHDNYKPTGLSRKYPNLLTQEGIRGDEHGPNALHTTTLPFTRFLAGPADFTFCYPNSSHSFSKNIKVSKGQQLALTVIYFSPLQSIFWYGKSGDYTNEREIEFFKYVPTVWDESHYLAGEIGQYISVARRKGDTWYIGNAAGLKNWKDSIRLNFLKKGVTYNAIIYEDNDENGISKRVVKVKKGDVFPIDIKASGGQAVILSPKIGS